MAISVTQMNQADFRLMPELHIHLVGIGGSGLSAIAFVLLGQGYVVTGSDQQENEITQALINSGADVFYGHDSSQIAQADVVLISSAIPNDNPEIIAAYSSGIPVMKRAEFLGILMKGTFGIAVAGSHGKTTTTGMLAQIMLEANLDPTIVVGGVLPSIDGNGRAGNSKYFLIEADEYDHMFLGLRPKLAVVTNVEYDHPDLFMTQTDYKKAFQVFVEQLPQDGRLVICSDDSGALELANSVGSLDIIIERYGLENADWQAVELRLNQLGGTDFLVENGADYKGLIRLRVPGVHNVRNALAAIVVASALGIEFAIVRKALAEFGGIGRRFEIVGEVGNVIVIDDYAHHPTEIQVTLAAARQRFPGRRIWAVWQPHTFSRTEKLLDEFALSFIDADRVVALDIYRSREYDPRNIETADVLEKMNHPYAQHVSGIDDAAEFILDRIIPGDIIITLTAGDGNQVGQAVLAGLAKRINGGGLTDE